MACVCLSHFGIDQLYFFRQTFFRLLLLPMPLRKPRFFFSKLKIYITVPNNSKTYCLAAVGAVTIDQDCCGRCIQLLSFAVVQRTRTQQLKRRTRKALKTRDRASVFTKKRPRTSERTNVHRFNAIAFGGAEKLASGRQNSKKVAGCINSIILSMCVATFRRSILLSICIEID